MTTPCGVLHNFLREQVSWARGSHGEIQTLWAHLGRWILHVTWTAQVPRMNMTSACLEDVSTRNRSGTGDSPVQQDGHLTTWWSAEEYQKTQKTKTNKKTKPYTLLAPDCLLSWDTVTSQAELGFTHRPLAEDGRSCKGLLGLYNHMTQLPTESISLSRCVNVLCMYRCIFYLLFFRLIVNESKMNDRHPHRCNKHAHT